MFVVSRCFLFVALQSAVNYKASIGNPPEKQRDSEVEFSHTSEGEEILHEYITLQCQS